MPRKGVFEACFRGGQCLPPFSTFAIAYRQIDDPSEQGLSFYMETCYKARTEPGLFRIKRKAFCLATSAVQFSILS